MCAKSKTPKLTVELIPKTCHYSNVRTTVTKQEWDKIRFISYEAANNKCEICGDVGKNQGYNHNVECHEIWEYDDTNHLQKLVGLISLCPICHQVKHIGRAMAMGRHQEAYNQLMKVNKWSPKQVEQHILESFELHKERSKHKWDLDITLLAEEPYNIKLKETKTRIFEVKKYKKKKKKPLKKKTAVKKTAAKKIVKKIVNKRPPRKSK
jgi:hypothetical protein